MSLWNSAKSCLLHFICFNFWSTPYARLCSFILTQVIFCDHFENRLDLFPEAMSDMFNAFKHLEKLWNLHNWNFLVEIEFFKNKHLCLNSRFVKNFVCLIFCFGIHLFCYGLMKFKLRGGFVVMWLIFWLKNIFARSWLNLHLNLAGLCLEQDQVRMFAQCLLEPSSSENVKILILIPLFTFKYII